MIIKQNYLFLLLPVYLVFVAVTSDSQLVGDEARYVSYATNLTQGFFINPLNPVVNVGPGYPLLLAPFLVFGLPLIIPTLLNAFFIFIAVLSFNKTLGYYTETKYAMIAAFILGLYPPIFRWMPLLHYESFAMFLVCGFIYYLTKSLRSTTNIDKDTIIASLFIGMLALTKYLLFYVVLTVLILLIFVWLFRRALELRKAIVVFALGVLVFSPYLVYAYAVTGKAFLTGTNGGEVLYHRSTPFEHELGNWFENYYILSDDTNDTYYDLTALRKNHRKFYQSIQHLNPIEKDSAFKAAALINIRKHPTKYIKNTIANIGRFFFHYPFSYRAQSLETYGYLLPNMLLITACLSCLIPAIRFYKRIPWSLLTLILMITVYCGAICFLGGRGRHFIIVVPFIILFVTYVLNHILSISYRITAVNNK